MKELCKEAFASRRTTVAERKDGFYLCVCGRRFRLGAGQRQDTNHRPSVTVPKHIPLKVKS